MVTGRAGERCEACGRGEDRPRQRWLEVHERWSYDEATHVQALRRLICLCTDCHRSTHFGLAQLRGLAGEALAHLRTVTGWSEQRSDEHLRAAIAVWQRRSRSTWTLDLGILTGAGVTVTPPPDAADRPGIAAGAPRTERPGDAG